MAYKINSEIFGELIQDEMISDWWNAGHIAIPFFENKPLLVTYCCEFAEVDINFLEEADQALLNFLKKTGQERLDISPLVYNSFALLGNRIIKMLGDEADKSYWTSYRNAYLHDLKDVIDIWKFLQPARLIVERRHRRDQDVYVCIDCDCEWDKEHGVLLVFRQGRKLTRVGQSNGHLTDADAYDIPDDKDELLSMF